MSLKSSECRRTIHFLFCVCSPPFLVQVFILGVAMQVDLNCAFEAKPRQDFVGLDCVGNLNQFHLGVFYNLGPHVFLLSLSNHSGNVLIFFLVKS